MTRASITARRRATRPSTLPTTALLVMASVLSLFAPGGGIDIRVGTSAPAPAPGETRILAPAPTQLPTSIPTMEPTATRTAAIDADDGAITEGEEPSPLESTNPALAHLDPDLLAAVQLATKDAEAAGIPVVVTSGWRSPEYQQSLLDDAVVTYGSEEEALKWVLTPERSSHVTGNAIDLGGTDADYWFIENGFRYGLCQTYANEIWHFELAVEPGEICPVPIADANAG